MIDAIRETAASESIRIADDLVLFRIAKAHFRYGQSYALLRPDATILVDAVHAATRAAVDRVLADAAPVAALVLTHADLFEQAFGPPEALSAWLGAPVLIGAADRSGTSAWPIEPDGTGEANALLKRLGVRVVTVPGHTPGSVVTLAEPEGYLFTGDAAIGPSYDADRTEAGVATWSHARVAPADFDTFAAAWQSVDGPVRALLPLHGQPAFGDDVLNALRAGDGGAFGQGLLSPASTMRA